MLVSGCLLLVLVGTVLGGFSGAAFDESVLHSLHFDCVILISQIHDKVFWQALN